MATVQQRINKLNARKDEILDQLEVMTSSSTGGKANASQPGAADHVGYKDGLYRELKEIEALLKMYDNELGAGDELGGVVISEGIV